MLNFAHKNLQPVIYLVFKNVRESFNSCRVIFTVKVLVLVGAVHQLMLIVVSFLSLYLKFGVEDYMAAFNNLTQLIIIL